MAITDTRNPLLKASPPSGSDPAQGSEDFTATDDLVLEKRGRGFHANADGAVQIEMPDGSTPTFVVKAGASYPYECVRIITAGTTVAGVVLL